MAKAFLSVSKDVFARLKRASHETGVPVGILVELAVTPAIGGELSEHALKWADRIATAKKIAE